jgi:hypothetical protein
VGRVGVKDGPEDVLVVSKEARDLRVGSKVRDVLRKAARGQRKDMVQHHFKGLIKAPGPVGKDLDGQHHEHTYKGVKGNLRQGSVWEECGRQGEGEVPRVHGRNETWSLDMRSPGNAPRKHQA